MYLINTKNCDIYYLLFYGDEILITRRQIYCINDEIVEKLNNGSIIRVSTN